MSEPDGCSPTHRADSPEVARARRILRGETAAAGELYDLAEHLKNAQSFGLARKLYGRAREQGTDDAKLRRKLRQRHALCTYKDPDLPAGERLTRALEILGDGEDLRTTTDQETLGLAGAIFKRRWEVDAQKENLERSLSYYLRGYRVGPETDQGYTAINAAFLLDRLASLEMREAIDAGTTSRIADTRREEADRIRRHLVQALPPLLETQTWLSGEWWFYATLAEACFGLDDYDGAEDWLARGKEKIPDIPAWEYQSTAVQLAALARLKAGEPLSTDAFEQTDAARVLRKLLGEHAAGVQTAWIGKVGLALSGGGFRASLFHIGVLARLAELDLLRHVEVLSCVSGGSILGAHYYLEVKHLLETRADGEVDQKDYIDCVKRIERQFLTGVQKNIRTRVAGGLITNLKMIFLPGYSRTMRAGELYERHLYSRVQDGTGGGQRSKRWLTDLYIVPQGEDTSFKPKAHNWRRRAKVPDLILNATTLNTGHNWQFTASWMGEPPGSINTDVDGNYRLRRMYYWEAPRKHRCIRLGHAVAASACVPGLFEPITLKGLYEKSNGPGESARDTRDRRITVRLVDGGVHDNQGIVGLLDQDCAVVLVSDASGQMGTQDHPSAGVLGVPLRSNSILMSRTRAEQYDELVARERSGLLRGLMFLHLKKDIDADPVDWVDTKDPWAASDDARPPARRGRLTGYGVMKSVQDRLAAVRTDLDSFSDAEAYALMASGYAQTRHAFEHEESLASLPVHDAGPVDWAFRTVEPAMTGDVDSRPLERLLDVAAIRAFKVWRLARLLRILSVLLGVAAALALVYLTWRYWQTPLIRVRTLGGLAIAAVATAVVGKWVVRAVQLRSTLQKIAIGAGLALVGWLAAAIHLGLFDRLYLKLGRAERVTRPS